MGVDNLGRVDYDWGVPCCANPDTFYADRLAAVRAQIIAYEAMMIAFENPDVTLYQLDTGQTRTYVQRAQLANFVASYERMLVLESTLNARVCGATRVGRPAF